MPTMASPLRSLSRGASRGALSLGSAVTPRSSQAGGAFGLDRWPQAALARAASNHSIRSLNSVGGRRVRCWTPKTPVTPRTPNAFFGASATAGYAAYAAQARTEESLPSLAPSEANSPERHGHQRPGRGGRPPLTARAGRHHPDLPILLGQAAGHLEAKGSLSRGCGCAREPVPVRAAAGALPGAVPWPQMQLAARKIWTPSPAPHERLRAWRAET